VKEIGVVRPHEKRLLPDEVATIVKAHGISIFCRCQFGRRWGLRWLPKI
jgi:hypothetical protein